MKICVFIRATFLKHRNLPTDKINIGILMLWTANGNAHKSTNRKLAEILKCIKLGLFAKKTVTKNPQNPPDSALKTIFCNPDSNSRENWTN